MQQHKIHPNCTTSDLSTKVAYGVLPACRQKSPTAAKGLTVALTIYSIFTLIYEFANSLDPDQAPQNIGCDLRSKLFDNQILFLQKLSRNVNAL